MKNLLLLLAFFGALTCTYSQKKITEADIKKLSWLEGTWTNLTTEPGTTGYEKWEKASDKEMKGTGATLKGTQVVFEEKLQIIAKDGHLYYVANVSENQGPVYFKFTELSDKGFVCENPEHDFPKKITYNKDGNKIHASISGGGKSFDFEFQKQ